MTRPALTAQPALRPAAPTRGATTSTRVATLMSADQRSDLQVDAGRAAQIRLAVASAPPARERHAGQAEPAMKATPFDRAPLRVRAGRWLAQAWESLYAALVLLAPLGVAGWFQAHAIHDRLGQIWTVSVGFTLAWEGAAGLTARLYVRALLRGDSTVILRLAMMVYAGVSCALLAWHLDAQGQPWYLAAAVGALTVSGIFLWARFARDKRRDELHASGKVDSAVVRFSLASWIASPLETPAALRYAIRHRIDQPLRAVTEYRAHRDRQRRAVALVAARAASRARALEMAAVRDQVMKDDVLLRTALVEAGRLLGGGHRITRDALAPAIRARGVQVSTERAGQLARQLSDELTEGATS